MARERLGTPVQVYSLVMFRTIYNHKSHILSVLQEAMKRILKQKPHPYEIAPPQKL